MICSLVGEIGKGGDSGFGVDDVLSDLPMDAADAIEELRNV